jgi:tetratricopeptide (TPR) repeat protein
MDPRNAGALLGLAQVAAQNQDLERALDLYRRAAANAGAEVWIAAWAFVHRGNIVQHQQDIDSARAEYGKVLELNGDLRGAGEAARKALAALVK